jgi:hypothetical protein
MISWIVLFACLATIQARQIRDPNIPVFTLVSACDDVQIVYGDGVREAHSEHWKTIRTSTPRTMIKTLAIECKNKGGPSGLIASTPDGRILTNSTWKCSTTYEENWNIYGFDDSHWNNAVVIDNNVHPKTHGWTVREGIRSDAQWIAAADTIPAGVTSYCRLDLVFEFVMICDDNSTLYADGQYIDRQNGFTIASNYMPIPKMATMFAIACSNKGKYGGFLGSSTDGRLVTDAQWKVSSKLVEGWNQPSFDDSHWINSYIVDNNVSPHTHGWIAQPQIASYASWIGGAPTGNPYKKPLSTQYFRRNIDCLWSACHTPQK